MRHFKQPWAYVLVYLACLGTSHSVSASLVDYVYSGNPFTQMSAGFPVSRVFIRFTVDDAAITRNAHVSLDSYSAKNLGSYVFSNGYQTLSNDPFDGFSVYTSATISFDTDAQGNIVGNWNASAGRAHGNLEGLMLADAVSSSSSLDSTSSLGGFFASVANNPGTWSRMGMSAVPVPGGLLLFASGLGVLGFRETFKGREKRKS